MEEHEPATYTLFCFVDGDERPFPVDFRPDKTVGALKKEIKLEKRPDLESFAANNLKLFKIDLLLDNMDETQVPEQIAKLNLPPEMDAMADLSDYYPTAPLKRINILVKLPISGKETIRLIVLFR
jgi:hypothetical protein